MERDKASLNVTEVDQSQLTEDQLVRRSMRKKEYKQIKERNKDFDEEEEELKRFFNEGDRREGEAADPTVVRTQLLDR